MVEEKTLRSPSLIGVNCIIIHYFTKRKRDCILATANYTVPFLIYDVLSMEFIESADLQFRISRTAAISLFHYFCENI
jgi:hypothetical protein